MARRIQEWLHVPRLDTTSPEGRSRYFLYVVLLISAAACSVTAIVMVGYGVLAAGDSSLVGAATGLVALAALWGARWVSGGGSVRLASVVLAVVHYALVTGLSVVYGTDHAYVVVYTVVVVVATLYLGRRAGLLAALVCSATYAGLSLLHWSDALAPPHSQITLLQEVLTLGAVLLASAGLSSLYLSLGEDATTRQEALRRVLQERVKERTAELAESNERLQEQIAQLRESEARLRAMSELAGGWAYALTVSPDGALHPAWSTEEAVKVMGYDPAQMQDGGTSLRFVHPDDMHVYDERRALLLRGLPHQAEYRIVRPDGEQRWLLDYVEPIFDPESGRVVGARGAARDITEWKEAQGALLEAERFQTVTRLAASLAHEISNPLQSILGCLRMAVEAAGDPARQTRYLNVASEEIQRASRIVRGLRDLSHAREDAPREPGDVNALLDQVAALTARRCRDAGVSVQLELGDGLPHPSIVRDQIEQVLLNLVLNAIDAMPNGGTLTLRTEATKEPPGVRVSVQDTGQGIPPDVVPRIFEFFYTTKASGTGLGLPISRGIVRQYGGTLDVESRPGQGTCFRMWLPAPPAGSEGGTVIIVPSTTRQ